MRLVKTGNGMMRIYGSAQAATLAENATHASNISVAGTHYALDGAFHRGGTTVVDGTLQMVAGVGTVDADHFRGSLGKTWKEYQGSKNTLRLNFHFAFNRTVWRVSRFKQNLTRPG